jgi:ABC-type ATPase involved in cell division
VSGDGKSTLLKLIVGEELAAKGIVCLGGEDMRSIPKPY